MQKILLRASYWALFSLIIWNCEKIPTQNGLPPGNLFNVDTLSLHQFSGYTIKVAPELGSQTRLYLGTFDSVSCDYALIQFAKVSSSNSLLTWSKLWESDSIVVDSIYFRIPINIDSTTLSTGWAPPDVNCYNFSTVSDSIFNESTTNYLNFTDADFQQGTLFTTGDFKIIPPDSGDPYLQWDFSNVSQTFIDSNSSRTVGLQLVNASGDSLRLFSSEASSTPEIVVSYVTLDTANTIVDTITATFLVTKDLTIAQPPEVSQKDQNQLTVSAARGLKAVLNLDLSPLDSLSGSIVYEKANLSLPVTDDMDSLEFNIWVAPIADTLTYSGFQDLGSDSISVQSYYLVSGTMKNNMLNVDMAPILQAFRQNSFPNLGLKLYGKTTSSPFQVLHIDPQNDSNTLKVTYVQAN